MKNINCGRYGSVSYTHLMVMLDSAQAHEINPYMSDEVIGAAWCPSDGHANALMVTLGYYKRARELGAHFITGEEVVELRQHHGRIAQVVTDHGDVYEADNIVVAAGFESRDILNTMGIDIPKMCIRDSRTAGRRDLGVQLSENL